MKKSQQTKTLTISLPIALYKTLEVKAERFDRSKNYLVRKALEAHLDAESSDKSEKGAKKGSKKNDKKSEE